MRSKPLPMLLVNISSFFYSETQILGKISFELEPGKNLAVLGESGCGKSTLLHLIYGLLDLNEGEIYWENKAILGPKHNLVPGEDYIKLVAQEYNIMPFTTVSENIATYLPRLDTEIDQQRIDELLEVVEMKPFAHTQVKNLSGGQKQRVALAKALAKEPKLLLLDEPFSHIDTFRKNKLRRNLYHYLHQKKITCITATHDAEEALAFSDYLIILKNGTVEAFDTTENVYNNLSSVYQAGFFGEVNVLDPHFLNDSPNKFQIIRLPHQLKISEEKTPLKVVIEASFFQGTHYLIKAKLKEKNVFFNHHTKLETGRWEYLKNKT